MKELKKEETISVSGMSCSGCELRIEEKLKNLPGIEEVQASFSKGTVRVLYDPEKTGRNEIIRAILDLGYTAEDKKEPEEPPKGGLSNSFGIVLVLAALYVIVRHTVGFDFINFIPQINRDMSYGILFVAGLFTSVHCLAMCGGISLSQCAVSGPTKQGVKKRLMPSFLYNSGRIVSYTVIGGTVGAVGSVISFSGTAKAVVTIFSGVFMLIMGLNMLNAIPRLRKINFRMPKFLGKKLLSSKKGRGPFYVGLLNGLMPCGPLQAMQLYALGTGSFLAGAFSMLMFGLGTVPLMFTFGAVSALLSAKFTHKMMRVSAVLVMVLGIFMASRGFALSGISVGTGNTALNAAKRTGNVQEITTSLTNGSYVPFSVQKGIPVKWTIKVSESDLNGCNNPVTVPKYGIQKTLVPGDNLIEFTPSESGTVTYTCWMGMIRSTITVVNGGS